MGLHILYLRIKNINTALEKGRELTKKKKKERNIIEWEKISLF